MLTRAAWPAHAATGAFSPGVVAVVATPMGVYRPGNRAVPELMFASGSE